MSEKLPADNELQNPARREFLKEAGAAGAVVLASPFLGASEALAERKKWVDLEDVIDLDTPHPTNWKGKLGDKNTGVIVNKDANVFWIFKNGKKIRTGPVLTADPVAFDTPEGLYHFTWQAGKGYRSRQYRVPMPYPTFIDAKDDKGRQRGIALHASSKLRKNSNGKIQVRGAIRVQSDGTRITEINTSHGCMNMLLEDAAFLQQQLRIKRGDRSTRYPIYIMASTNSLSEGDQESLVVSIDTLEGNIANSTVLESGSAQEILALLDTIPQTPSVHDLSESVAKRVYSKWRHASGDATDRSKDPLMRLRSKNRWDSKEKSPVIGNTIRIGQIKALATAHVLRNMTGASRYDESLKDTINVGTIIHRGFFSKQQRNTVPIQKVTSLTDSA
ncbi:MAG: L,D-transpeptidase, partial [Candidatus Pacebacteria bacterium]|nr:L,D-transpeptidase [Candidatus Paceibacterota bacterium]